MKKFKFILLVILFNLAVPVATIAAFVIVLMLDGGFEACGDTHYACGPVWKILGQSVDKNALVAYIVAGVVGIGVLILVNESLIRSYRRKND